MSKVWTSETENILVNHWDKSTPFEIAVLINKHLRILYSDKYEAFPITSARGVIFAAERIGIISKEQCDALIKSDTKNKNKRRYVSAKTKARIFERDKKCLCCSSTKDLTIDHIKSIWQNADSIEDNLQTLCRRCNILKGPNEIDYRKPKW